MRILAAVTAMAALLGTAPLQSFAQAYPNRIITAIYPSTAGGTGDTLFRLVLEEAGKALGQRFVVENRPGASFRIGVGSMLRSPPDGYTISMIANTIAVNIPLLDPAFKIEPDKDYVPIGLIYDVKFILAAHPSVPFRDGKGMIAFVKANPGKLSFASNGVGSGPHLAMELLKLELGLDMVHVPYKGEAPMMSDLVAGHVPALFGTGVLKPHIDAGRVVAIATSGKERWSFYPNVPTIRESFGADISISSWVGVAGPPGLPDSVTGTLNKAIGDAVNTAVVRQKMEELGVTPLRGSPKEFGDLIRADLMRWSKVFKVANIKLD